MLVRYGIEVLRRELAYDQVDDVEQPATVATAQDLENRAQVDNDRAEHGLANQHMTEPGWIEIPYPVSGERFEIEAASCPPSWRAPETKETYQRQLWGHPP